MNNTFTHSIVAALGAIAGLGSTACSDDFLEVTPPGGHARPDGIAQIYGVIGFPIAHADFTGKTVIPFCTSATSDIGDSGKLLAQMAGTGEWLDGKRFAASASRESVESWVKQLDWD